MKISIYLRICAIVIALFFVVDNVYFSSTQKQSRQYSVQFRHAGFYDGDHTAPPYYRNISNSSLQRGTVKFRTGDLGEVLPHGGTGSCKVFFIGGSTTESHWMPEDKRWPYLVGMSNDLQSKIVTYNFGVGGYNLHQNSTKYLAMLRSLKPQIVVVNHQINDIGKHLNGGYYEIEGSDLHNSYTVETNSASTTARLKDLVFKLFPTTAGIWRTFRNETSSARGLAETSKKEVRKAKVDFEAQEFLSRLKTLHQMIVDDGAQLVLIHQVNRSADMLRAPAASPAKTQLEEQIASKGLTPEEYIQLISSYSKVLKGFAETTKTPLIDGDLEFGKFKSDDFMYDSIHFTEAGSVEFSKIIAAGLAQHARTRCN